MVQAKYDMLILEYKFPIAMKKGNQMKLSHDYVFNDVFMKISDTFDKYRASLPAIEDVERAITKSREAQYHDDDGELIFAETMHILNTIKEHAKTSPLVAEIFENVRRDFWHGIDPDKVSKHQGKYYIDSVGD